MLILLANFDIVICETKKPIKKTKKKKKKRKKKVG